MCRNQITLNNSGASDVTYDLSHAPAVTASGINWTPSVNAEGYAPLVVERLVVKAKNDLWMNIEFEE